MWFSWWYSTHSYGKTLNQASLVSNFDFLGTHSSVVYEPNLWWVPVNKLQNYLKPVLQKLLQFSSPSGLGFQVQKLIVTNFKVELFFHIPSWAFPTRTTLSRLQELNLPCLTSLITLALLMLKRMGLLLSKNYLLRSWGCLSLLKCH